MVNSTDSILFRLDNLNSQQLRVNYQMATGKKIDNGSDDSKTYLQELYINDKIRVYEGLETQVQKTNVQNNTADDTIKEIKNLLEQIKAETLKARNDTVDADLRKSIAVQIEGAKENLYTLVNEKVEDEYIFSGSDTNKQAFSQDSNGKVTYEGNPHLREVAVEFGSYRERGVTGIDIMMYDTTAATTPAAFTFEEGEKVLDENGLEWKINAGTLTQYDEDGTATGKTLTTLTTGVSPNEVYTTSGSIIPASTPADVSLTAKHNIFDAIDDIITALNANDTAGISTGIDAMDEAFDATNAAHAALGGRNKTFELSLERIQSKLTHFNVLAIENSAADLTKVAIEAKQLELTYTSLYSTINRMSSLSLVKFLS